VTEADWRVCDDPAPMLALVRRGGPGGRKKEWAGGRKERLFFCACCRRLLHVLSDPVYLVEVELSERYADGRATAADLLAARARWPWGYGFDSAFRVLPDELTWLVSDRVAEAAAQADLLREVFGNPFRPVTPDPSWRTSTVLALAAGIHGELAFDLMPILADALMDAGCDDADVLDHCRGGGPHVRGCWLVDLLLGKD
jgi:hypothetical protein